MNYDGARVAVLGASGFIGRWVAKLLPEHAQKYLVVRDPDSAQQIFKTYGIRGRIVTLDLKDTSLLQNLFQEIQPSIVFSLAGYGVDPTERDQHLAWEVNARLPKRICEALWAHRDPHWQGRHLIHVGSALEYGLAGGNLSEETLPKPSTLYGRTKLAGTEVIRRSNSRGIRAIVARLFTVYGPGEFEGRLLPSLIQAARTANPIQLTAGNQKRDFTYVGDVVEGLLRLGLVSAKSETVVNLATGKLRSVKYFAETAARFLGIPPEHLQFGALPPRAEEMCHEEVSTERLRKLTEWAPSTSVEEGIAKTMNFLEAIQRTKHV